MKFSIVIPNWNGKHLLEKNLPAVLATGADEVIVIDNGSTDGSGEMVRKMVNDQWSMDNRRMINDQWSMINRKRKNQQSIISYRSVAAPPAKPLATHGKAMAQPSQPLRRRRQRRRQPLAIRLIENKTNLGFATACNQGVEKAKGEVVVLLNNDVVPKKNFLEALVPHFKNKDIFAVSCHEPQFSWAKGEWIKGFVEHKPGKKTKKAHISFWASGGSAAFSRSKWQILGGFDTLYDPFYWEDIDLSYRAWKRGWRILWEPKSMVLHKHEATVGQFSKTYIDFISQRNQLLFIWKNITSPKMMLEHKFWLGKRLLTTPGYWRPFLAALAKKPPILLRRFKEFREEKISDEKIFAQFYEDERVLS